MGEDPTYPGATKPVSLCITTRGKPAQQWKPNTGKKNKKKRTVRTLGEHLGIVYQFEADERSSRLRTSSKFGSSTCVCAQSRLTCCEPMDCSLPGSSVHDIFRQEYWSWLPFPIPGDLPDLGIKPLSPALAGRFFTTAPRRKSLGALDSMNTGKDGQML